MYTKRCLLAAAAVALLLALAGHAEAVPSGKTDAALRRNVIYDVNINSLIDANMPAIRSTLSDMDPMEVQDMKLPLFPHIFLQLHTGWMQNLSLLKRAGKCSVRYTNRIMTLDMNFGWNEIAVDYRYLLKVLLKNRKGDLHVQLSDLKVHIVVDVNLEAYEIRLRRMEFINTRKITVKLEGHLTDAIYNLMMKGVTTFCRSLVLKTIESKVLSMVQSTIDDFNYSIGKNHNRMFELINLVIPFDYKNGIDQPSIDNLLLEKH